MKGSTSIIVLLFVMIPCKATNGHEYKYDESLFNLFRNQSYAKYVPKYVLEVVLSLEVFFFIIGSSILPFSIS